MNDVYTSRDWRWLHKDCENGYQRCVGVLCGAVQGGQVLRHDECRMRQSEVTFRTFPSNPYNSFCVEALIPRESAHGYEKLGHVARDPARLLSPLLLALFKITG